MKKLWLIILSLFLASNAQATDFFESWDTGWIVGNCSSNAPNTTCSQNSNWLCQYPTSQADFQGTRFPERMRIVNATDTTASSRAGSQCLRLETKQGDFGIGATNYRRSTISSLHGSELVPWDGWFAISTFDSDGAFTYEQPESSQPTNTHISHHISGIGVGWFANWITEGPALDYVYKMRWTRRSGTSPNWVYNNYTYCKAGYGCHEDVDIGSRTADAGKWNDWVVRIVHDITPPYTGILEVYKNGTRIINTTGMDFGYADSFYFHVDNGYGTNRSDPYVGLVYFDEIRRRTTANGGSYASTCPTIHPKAPTNTAPSSGATDVALNPTITASQYLEGYTDAARSHITDATDAFRHLATQFQVDVGVSPTWSSPIYNKTVCNPAITKPSWCDEQNADVGGGSTVSVSSWAVNLANNTLYSVRMRHANMAYISGTAGVDRDFDGSTPPTDTGDVYWGSWSTVTTFTTIAAGGGGGGPAPGAPTHLGTFIGSR